MNLRINHSLFREATMAVTEVEGTPGGATKRSQPTGPRGHWLLGCSGELKRDQLGFYERTYRDHGGIARVRIMAGMYLTMLFRPEDVEHVLVRNHRNYRKP